MRSACFFFCRLFGVGAPPPAPRPADGKLVLTTLSLRRRGPTGLCGAGKATNRRTPALGHRPEGQGRLLQPVLGGSLCSDHVATWTGEDTHRHTNHGHLQRAFAQPTTSQPGLHTMSSLQLQLRSCQMSSLDIQMISEPHSKISLRQRKSFASAIITMTACKMGILYHVSTKRGRVPGLGGWHVSHTLCVSGAHET